MKKSEIEDGHVVVDIKPNCKSVNIDFDKRTVVMEDGTDWSPAPEPKFKKGDILIEPDYHELNIFIWVGGEKCIAQLIGECLFINGNPGTCLEECRLATDSEKQILLDKLHESGKDLDSEKLEIVDWVWRPKIGEGYYTVGACGITASVWRDDNVDNGRWDNGFVFRTEKLAESALEQLKKARHF